MKKTDVTRDAQVAITQKNELLTIEQLRKMSGMPAWWDDGSEGCWGIIAVDAGGRWKLVAACGDLLVSAIVAVEEASRAAQLMEKQRELTAVELAGQEIEE